MANLTKAQAKARVKALINKLSEIKDEVEELKNDVEEESYSIEPYEGKEELTPAQEERQEWLDNLATELDSMMDYLEAEDLKSAVDIEE